MSKEQEIAKCLLEKRDNKEFWFGIEKRLKGETNKKTEYNRFFFIAIMDRQMKAEKVVINADNLINNYLYNSENLHNSENLWAAIRNTNRETWNKWWKKGKFHRFRNRVCDEQYENADIMKCYDDDARKIWEGCKNASELKKRLQRFRGVGLAITNMIIGGLFDLKQIDPKQIDPKEMDVKPDVHVRRVLGRVFTGKEFTREKAAEKAGQMHPENPWKLDRSIFTLGRNYCHAKKPKCEDCYLKTHCKYYRQNDL